jgi:hypothetical protein
MTEEDFRAIALSMPGAVEGSHMGHADFRAGGPKEKIFATLNCDDDGIGFGVVMLTPEEQAAFVNKASKVFEPVKGKWGERGATTVLLKGAGKRVVRQAVEAAWRGKTGTDR